ncbi:MAG: hypothetical protein ACJAVK_000596, partial [Akkermansiaceae bacterium]
MIKCQMKCPWSGLVAAVVLALSLVGSSFAQEPPPAEPTEETEVRDLSEPPLRTVKASFSFYIPRWNVAQQKVSGLAVGIRFGGPAAPLDRVGKVALEGSILMTPEVAGEWKWQGADRLEFFPTAGWLPPGGYRFAVGPGLLAKDCVLAARSNFNFNRVIQAPLLTAQFSKRNYYVDPATPSLQQLVTTVDFSQPVSHEEAKRRFSVTSVTGIEI